MQDPDNKYKQLFSVSYTEQLEQMKANSHKDGWDHLGMYDAVRGIQKNLDTLIEGEIPSRLEIVRRFANIANFAAMGIYHLENSK